MSKLPALLIGLSLLTSAMGEARADGEEITADLSRQAYVAYAGVLSQGVRAGRLYSREATASGAKRHAEEFVARQYLPAQGVVSMK